MGADGGASRPARWASWFLAVGLLGGLYGCWSMISGPVERTPERAAAYKFEGALMRCRNGLRDRLADSRGYSTDEFARWQSLASAEDEHTFAFGFVARNAFGALVPARATCRVAYDGSYWSVVSLDVSG